MRCAAVIIVVPMLVVSQAYAAPSVLIGRGLSNTFVAESVCPENAICLDAFYRWEFMSTRTVAGPAISGHVRAVISQHVEATPSFVRSVELFVVTPIDDPAVRRTYGAEYFLLALSPRYKSGRYCVPMPLAEIGLADVSSEIIVDPDTGYHCISARSLR